MTAPHTPLTPAQKAMRLALIRSVHARRMREHASPDAGVSERDGFEDEGFGETPTFGDEDGETL